jgi:hypothetical protein
VGNTYLTVFTKQGENMTAKTLNYDSLPKHMRLRRVNVLQELTDVKHFGGTWLEIELIDPCFMDPPDRKYWVRKHLVIDLA